MHKVRKKAHREVIDKHCNTGYYFKSVITYKRLRGCAEEISFCKSVFHGNNNITNYDDFEAFLIVNARVNKKILLIVLFDDKK